MSDVAVLSDDKVREVAELAELSVSDDEVGVLGKQLSSVLGYIAMLEEIDTSDVEETAQVTGLENIMREVDGVGIRMINKKKALGQARRKDKDYFVVEGVLENKD